MDTDPIIPASRKVFDCFLYNGESDVLRIRLHELCDVVHRFIVVEATTTFSGLPKAITFNPLEPHFAPFAKKIRHVVVSDMPKTENPWEREAWQRNAILRGVPDADIDDLILLSDVDEIPRAAVVREMALDSSQCVFGLRLAFYYFFVNYRNVEGPESAISWTIAAARHQFEKTPPNDLRYAVRNGTVAARILSDAGWHFSYLTDEAGIRQKIRAFSHQEFNNESFLASIDVLGTIRRGEDLFKRPGFRWSLVEITELPLWLQEQRRSLSRLFYPNFRDHLKRWFGAGKAPNSRQKKPVIICPYVYDNEPGEIRRKFGLDSSRARKLQFFLWQDVNGIGPERAFEHCWNQFPDQDIIIVHSDMAPMPGDQRNEWYDTLMDHRTALSDAGMLACNLFYPRSAQSEQQVVQCAGGSFENGEIGYLHGPVVEAGGTTGEGVAKKVLQQTRSVSWVTFGGVLIRREIIRACGSFDHRYEWAYVMDVDYSFEARLRGFRLYQVPVALQHEGSRTTHRIHQEKPELKQLAANNLELFYDKWRPFFDLLSPNVRAVHA